MPAHPKLNRRTVLKAAGGLGAALLAGCDQISESKTARPVFQTADTINYYIQRAFGPNALAAEFSEADLSPAFRANGTLNPNTPAYTALARNNFADWRLDVRGLVERPSQLSLADLRALPARTQITRHDCVEGWSCIGKWKGARLSALLKQVGLKPSARYIIFHCADYMGGNPVNPTDPYYESIDLNDAFHEQTILAYEMNGQALQIPHGAPLRLRVERQLGYKHAKYIVALEAVESFDNIRGGNGSFWADNGYAWYAGI